MALDKITTAIIADDAVTAAKIVAGAVGTSEIADGTVVASDIGDNSITLAKMAGGTDGQVITYDASGDPVAVGPGTDGQVLTSTGAGSPPAFEAVPVSDIVSTATGGTTIYTEGDYKVHVYKTSSTFATGTLGGTVQYLIVLPKIIWLPSVLVISAEEILVQYL